MVGESGGWTIRKVVHPTVHKRGMDNHEVEITTMNRFVSVGDRGVRDATFLPKCHTLFPFASLPSLSIYKDSSSLINAN